MKNFIKMLQRLFNPGKLYEKLEKIYTATETTGYFNGVFIDRKIVPVSGKMFGFDKDGDFVIYEKASINKVKPGDAAIPYGYKVWSIVKNPKRKRDGFVIAIWSGEVEEIS